MLSWQRVLGREISMISMLQPGEEALICLETGSHWLWFRTVLRLSARWNELAAINGKKLCVQSGA